MSGTGVAINECRGKPLKYDVDLQRLLATSLGELDARRVVCQRKVTAAIRKCGGGMCEGGRVGEEMLSEHATTCVDFGFTVISVGEPAQTHTPHPVYKNKDVMEKHVCFLRSSFFFLFTQRQKNINFKFK